MEEKFIFRYYTPTGWWEGKFPRATVVGIHEDGLLKIAASRCGVDDMFSRQKGRFIAETRLKEGKLIGSFPMKDCRIADFIPYAKAISDLVCENPRILNNQK